MTTDQSVSRRFNVTLTQAGVTLASDGSETILDLAQRNDIDYPCGCESGVCGACKSVLLQGQVEMLPHSPLALSDADRQRGMVLACRAMARADIEIAWLDADDPPPPQPRRRMMLTVTAVDRLTHDIVRIRLAQPEDDPFQFTSGQSANLCIEGLPSRPYSMASQSSDPYVEFHVRKVPGGRLSTYLFDKLSTGDAIEIDGPFGASYLRAAHDGPIICLAGGSGLAPVLSVLTAALRQIPDRAAILLHGVRDEADVYYEREVAMLQVTYPTLRAATVLSRCGAGSRSRLYGNLADVLEAFDLPVANAKAYLAGPPIMVETCMSKLHALKVERENCHADAFVQASTDSAIDAVADGVERLAVILDQG
ncbi:MAG: 2Fe-2S iron-sulfur cluster binding domain-containing protein [Rhizobiales bacterium]|nr:2Fe-2S iron-sulfur cluster binding domain-containing protein [Hyphomicrobiales bacterium]